MAETLVIEGRERVRRRRASPQTIDAAQMETFFVTLGETCNVVRSARAAGFSSSWAYKLRQRDAGFRNGWAQAVREGYAKLELVLLERAMKGTPKPVFRPGGGERIVREYSTALAVALLRRHAETADSAGYEPGEDEMRELRDKILAKLERVRERDAATDPSTPEQAQGGIIETKAAVDRVELIVWGLRRQGRGNSPHPPTASRRVPPSPLKGEGFLR